MRLTKQVRGWCPGLTIVARARDAGHAAELYRAGATDAVPETLESSLQLSEAVLVDLGMRDGPGDRLDPREARRAAPARSWSGARSTREPPLKRRRLRDA